MRQVVLLLAGLLAAAARPELSAQARTPDLSGTWEAQTPDGPQTLIVRPDSTASFGDETVTWRIEADTIFILFGDEWVGYHFELAGDTLTLSGGDLEDPVSLTRIGPVPPRWYARSTSRFWLPPPIRAAPT